MLRDFLKPAAVIITVFLVIAAIIVIVLG